MTGVGLDGLRRIRAWHVHSLTVVLSFGYLVLLVNELLEDPTLGMILAVPVIIGVIVVYFGVLLLILILLTHTILKYGAIVGLVIIAAITIETAEVMSAPRIGLLGLLTITIVLAFLEVRNSRKS